MNKVSQVLRGSASNNLTAEIDVLLILLLLKKKKFLLFVESTIGQPLLPLSKQLGH